MSTCCLYRLNSLVSPRHAHEAGSGGLTWVECSEQLEKPKTTRNWKCFEMQTNNSEALLKEACLLIATQQLSMFMIQAIFRDERGPRDTVSTCPGAMPRPRGP